MKTNKKNHCYEALKNRILTLDIEPGTVLDETVIAEEYKLSRTPLREIFQRLAGEGYVSLEDNRSTKVSSMDINSMRDFFQTAPLVYASVARLAAEKATPSQLKKLKEIQISFLSACEKNDAEGMSMRNHAFHEQLGVMAGNHYLSPSLKRLLIDHTRMSQMFFRPKNSKEEVIIGKASHHHDLMIEAIEKRLPADIVELTLEHWELSRNRMEQFVRPDPLPVDIDSFKKLNIK
ncbi:MAG: DNA-binding GntR family transcriptional regulator [Cocleimonas sp.]|jgi:DNA-binding GntR family transcriptional regulator